MNVRRRQRRFTLIEMLIVITIICILAALLSPALQKSLMSARMLSCANNQKQIAAAAFLYTDNHRGYFFSAGTTGWSDKHSTNIVHDPWYRKIFEGGAEVFFCPEDGIKASVGFEARMLFGFVSYGYNAIGLGGAAEDRGWGWGAPYNKPARIRAVKQPSRTVIACDNAAATDLNEANNQKLWGYYHVYGWYDPWNPAAFPRHFYENCNVLWADGHLDKVMAPTAEILYKDGWLGAWWGKAADNCWDPYRIQKY